MTPTEFIAIVVAVLSLILAFVAAYYNKIRTEKATQTLSLEQQLAQGNAVIHFSSRFFDLLKVSGKKELVEMVDDENWIYQYWSLHATEFFFFQHGLLPVFMYSLWMI